LPFRFWIWDLPAKHPLVRSLPKEGEHKEVLNPKSKIQNELDVALDIIWGNA
jgi:hypothetical protein